MHVRQHIPNSVSGVERAIAEVSSTEELLALPWVVSRTTIPKFYRFSVNRDDDEDTLMAEYDEGRSWWVVAFVDGRLDLPEWTPKER
jgi:hypothetical protein